MAAGDTVNLQNFPQQLATALGIPLFAGEILATIILMAIIVVPTLFLMRGKNPMLAFIMGFLVLCFGVALSWIPIWTFAVMTLAVAVLFGKKIVEMF